MKRCAWCLGSSIYEDYHDREWGNPLFDDLKLFELINLEGMQAGLSWITILNKRENYRNSFDQFDPKKIVKYDQIKIHQLLQNKGIIRNKMKIEAIIKNSNAYLNILDRGISFRDYIWKFVDGHAITNSYSKISEIPAFTEKSIIMSKELKKDGFSFVGKTICYAYMQSTGMVNDHITECFRYKEILHSIYK